ncbi:hypothetical protein BASA82_000018 [Batrachochytrium salamandrivorans]|nr:hypothetical protein BASA82_000018 [Batrachochytrium salamandrivorans]
MMMLSEEASRLSRGHIRFFASVERAGPWFKVFMSVFPILVNFAWVAIYFVERDNDVFREGGACSYVNRSQLYDGPSPYFITTRSTLLWQTQTLFAMLNAFLWAPFRYMRTGLTTSNFLFLMVIELLTVFPFLVSLVFFPAYVAYVPTYLRGFIMKHEVLFVMSKEGVKDRGNRLFLTWSLMLDLFSTMITVIGVLEWAQNNFPHQDHDALYGQPDSPVFGCYSFFICIYWFIVTISTVGYGDIIPLNNMARLIIVLSIAFFLLFLPDFINRVTTILRLSANLQQVEFPPQTKRNFVIVDGTFALPTAQQALTLLQPKFHHNEFAVKNLVLILPDDSNEASEFTRLTTDQSGLFCELFLMQGRVLQSDDGLLRSQARFCKSIYLLPKFGLQEFTRSKHAHASTRESMAESREFCLRRDFDQIKRLGGLRNRMGKGEVARTRTILFHESNRKLVETPLTELQSSCCDPMHIVCLDSFGQRIAASTVLVPGFNTLWALLMLSGSATDKTFSEYDAEADGERITHHLLSHRARSSSQSMTRRMTQQVDEEGGEEVDNDDAEFVLGLHHTLLLAEFTGTSSMLNELCILALEHRVLVLGFVLREHVCAVHFDFKHGMVQWLHSATVRTGDYLVCFGDSYQIAQLNDPTFPFWKRTAPSSSSEDEEDEYGGITYSNPLPLIKPSQPIEPIKPTLARRQSAREGDFKPTSAEYHTHGTRRELHEQFLADARGGDVELGDNAMRRQLQDHVIVYTASHVSFVYFVKKLRSLGLGETVPVLLMDPRPPNSFHWSEVGVFPDVYFLQGSPFILDDLIRAGFEHARCLVLLVDFRAHYQLSGSINIDEDNLLAEKVACKLKLMLQCNTRIVTHLVREEHFEYIEGNQTRLGGLSHLPRLQHFAALFQTTVWPPIQSVSYIAGECFFPSIFLPLFFASETRGNWLAEFLHALCDVAGNVHYGLVFTRLDEHEFGLPYSSVALDRLRLEGGLAIGVFRNYDCVTAKFRGVLLFPPTSWC